MNLAQNSLSLCSNMPIFGFIMYYAEEPDKRVIYRSS